MKNLLKVVLFRVQQNTVRIRFLCTIYISNDRYTVGSVLKSLVNTGENYSQNLSCFQLLQPDPLSFSRCAIVVIEKPVAIIFSIQLKTNWKALIGLFELALCCHHQYRIVTSAYFLTYFEYIQHVVVEISTCVDSRIAMLQRSSEIYIRGNIVGNILTVMLWLSYKINIMRNIGLNILYKCSIQFFNIITHIQ